MNSATGHFTTLDPFKEDACPVTLAEEEVLNAKPTLIYVSVQEFLPDKPQPIDNTLPFCQTKIDLVLSATYATTEVCYEGTCPSPSTRPRPVIPHVVLIGAGAGCIR